MFFGGGVTSTPKPDDVKVSDLISQTMAIPNLFRSEDGPPPKRRK